MLVKQYTYKYQKVDFDTPAFDQNATKCGGRTPSQMYRLRDDMSGTTWHSSISSDAMHCIRDNAQMLSDFKSDKSKDNHSEQNK